MPGNTGARLADRTQGEIVHTDETAATPRYYMFLSWNGWWYIMREVLDGGIATYSYTTGQGGYTTAWTNRATLTYVAPSAL